MLTMVMRMRLILGYTFLASVVGYLWWLSVIIH